MSLPESREYQQMRSALRKAAIERNVKTGLILGVAASGALFGLAGLAATAASATIALSIAKWRQDHAN